MNLKKLSILACFNLSFHWFAIGIVIPIMTLFLLEKGLSLFQVGISFATYSAATVLLELPTGGLADSIGRKKVYLLALVLQIIGSIVIIFLNEFTGIIACFILMGASRSLSSGTMDAHFIDEFYRIDPDVNLQKEIAKIGIFIPIALGIGSLIGGFLPMSFGSVTKESFLDSVYSANYLAYILAMLIQLISTFSLVKEEKKNGEFNTVAAGFKKVPEVIKTSVTFGIKHPVIFLILITTFAWGFSISGLEQLWQPQVKGIIDVNTGSWIFGLLTCGYFFAASLGNVFVSPICHLFKDNYPVFLFAARLVMGILYFILALQTGIIMFSVFYVALFMFNGMQSSPESAIFNKEVPSDKRSTLLSFSSLFLHSGGVMGSVLLGFMAQTYSIKTAWIAASVVIGTSALLYLFIPLAKQKNVNREKSETGILNGL